MDTWGLRMLFPPGVRGHSIRGLLWVVLHCGGFNMWDPKGPPRALDFLRGPSRVPQKLIQFS